MKTADDSDDPLRHLRLAAVGDRLVFEITSDFKHRTIHILRSFRPHDGPEVEVGCGFSSPEAALAWVDADPIRFEHPKLIVELKEVIRGLFEHFESND